MGWLKIVRLAVSAADSAGKITKRVFFAERNLKTAVNRTARKIKAWIAAFFLLTLVLVVLLEILLGGVISLKDSIVTVFTKDGIRYTQEEIAAAVNDAGVLYEYMEKEEELFAKGMLLLDKGSVMRILKQVDAYNKEVEKKEKVTYEYRVEEGLLEDLPKMDAYGNLIKKENKEDKAPPESMESSEEDKTKKEKVPYTVTYVDATVESARKNIDSTSQLPAAEDIFYLRWQPIVVLCNLYIQANHKNWGTYNDAWELGASSVEDTLLEKEWQEENYYLSDEQIEEVLSIYTYEYAYESDYTNDTWRNLWGLINNKILFGDFKRGKSAYKINISESVKDEKLGVVSRVTQYVPMIAPTYVRNSYIDFTYHYTVLENGDQELTQRTITVSPVSLINKMKELAPHMTEGLFLESLKLLPGAADLVSFYRDTIFAMEKNGQIINDVTDSEWECPVIGTIVSNRDNTVTGGGDVINRVEGSAYIHLYPSDGWNGNSVYLRPAPWIMEEGSDYGIYEITGAALSPLTSPDNATKSQIVYFLKNYRFDSDGKTRRNCPLFASEQAIFDTAECLLSFQEKTGASISGLFGIIIQEGGFRSSTLGKENWNFFSYTAGSSWQYNTVEYNGHRFRDYKDKYEKIGSAYQTLAVGAFEEQLYLVYDNYWNKGQDTYYKMVWNNTDVSDRSGIYAGIRHSYCPPWQDKSMPFSADSHVGSIYYWKGATTKNVGWVNRCGAERLKVLDFMMQ